MTTFPAPGEASREGAFDAVLCDVDNVIRFYDTSAVTRLEQAAGIAPGTTAKTAFAPEVDMPLLLGEVTKPEWGEVVARELAGQMAEATARELGAALAASPFHAEPAVVELLRRVRASGLPVVLVTNASVELEDELAELGLADLADHVVSSARVRLAKPDPRIYRLAVDLAGVPARRCLFVDDTQENVEAAETLGMTGVHYTEPADLRRALAGVLGACPDGAR